jgi:hypothetical protein
VRSRCESVVGLELDHRPDRDAHGGERVLERLKLREQVWLDALARLVIGPEVIAEGLDHVIGSDADVCGAGLDHLQHRVQHPGNGAKRLVLALVEGALPVEMAEQLVGSVD